MTNAPQTPQGKAYDSNENMKPADRDGPPRPATEPEGSSGATSDAPTATDPNTGEPKV